MKEEDILPLGSRDQDGCASMTLLVFSTHTQIHTQSRETFIVLRHV